MVLEFLKYAYFNMTKGDSMNDTLIKCAEKAYLDLCRTIKFNTENKDTRKGAKQKICEMLVHEYDILENAVKGSDEKQNAFDCEHKRICEEIINTYSEISELTYGQAQKWLNMMLKYVLMTAEDFAYFTEKVNGGMLLLGTGREDYPTPLHSSRFTFDENLMALGVKAYGILANGQWGDAR